MVAGADGRLPAVPPRWPELPRRRAAVLILFHADSDGEALLTLTERSAGGHRHAGQISLPGGAIEEGETAVEAALREAAEEVGLDASQADVTIGGVLPTVDVSASGFLVEPVIGYAAREPILVPDGREVASIFSARMAAFLPSAPMETVVADRDGFRLRYGGYRIGGHHVWGATAFLLARLGAYVARAESGVKTPGA